MPSPATPEKQSITSQAPLEEEELSTLTKMASSLRMVAGGSGALAVLLGAFGAHALRARVTPDELEVWKTASTYHFIHTLAILANSSRQGNRQLLSNKLFLAGMLVFSGSLYALVLTGQKKLGAVTPIGGFLLVGGWIALAYESSSA